MPPHGFLIASLCEPQSYAVSPKSSQPANYTTRLVDDGQNILLSHNQQLLAMDFDFGAGIGGE
jgi:hypothetical protein